jgi:hypothetical protein
MAIHLFTSRIHHDIADLRELVDITERHLKNQVNRLEKRIAKEIESISDEEEREYTIGWYTDDFVRLDKVYPNIQRRAMFTTLMCMVEANMLLGCKMCHCAFNLPREFKKKGKKRLILQAMEYLCCYLTIRDQPIKQRWEFVQKLWLIRNALVHNDGKPKPSNLKAITEFCDQIPTIELDHNNSIILKEGSMQMTLHAVNSFFSRLVDEIKRNKLPKKDN